MQLVVFHSEAHEESKSRNASCRPPYHFQRICEGDAHLSSQGLFERADGWDDGIRDLDASGEERDKVRGEAGLQFVLQDCAADRDAPHLSESPHEPEEPRKTIELTREKLRTKMNKARACAFCATLMGARTGK